MLRMILSLFNADWHLNINESSPTSKHMVFIGEMHNKTEPKVGAGFVVTCVR